VEHGWVKALLASSAEPSGALIAHRPPGLAARKLPVTHTGTPRCVP
jgi:hypothetical protein